MTVAGIKIIVIHHYILKKYKSKFKKKIKLFLGMLIYILWKLKNSLNILQVRHQFNNSLKN